MLVVVGVAGIGSMTTVVHHETIARLRRRHECTQFAEEVLAGRAHACSNTSVVDHSHARVVMTCQEFVHGVYVVDASCQCM